MDTLNTLSRTVGLPGTQEVRRHTGCATNAVRSMRNIVNFRSIVGYPHHGRIAILCCLIGTGAAYGATCAEQNPSGPKAILECVAREQGFADATTFWNTKLFNQRTLDGYCKSTPSISGALEQTLFEQACGTQKGGYFSYESFVSADEELSNKIGSSYQFMRVGTLALKLQEFANFLATASQETSGNGLLATKYEQDGLYFRYEVGGPLQRCWQPAANPNYMSSGSKSELTSAVCRTKTATTFFTDYYPLSSNVVAVQNGTGLINTRFVSARDCQYDLTKPFATYTCWDGGSKLPTLIGGTYPPPSGYSWQYMNQIIEPGYWIGMGNLQLTEVSMAQFFGWYYQNIAIPVQNDANFSSFVIEYLKNGKLAWMGGLWFWNFRSKEMLQGGSGSPTPSLHAILTSSKEACHDIGITTALVNGTSCNDTEGRTAYYNYYKANVFKLPAEGVPFTVGTTTSTSMICSQAIVNYCTN